LTEVKHVSQCETDLEFTDSNYKPAPDGLFTIKLGNPDQVPALASQNACA
jgi:hypothetical protein